MRFFFVAPAILPPVVFVLGEKHRRQDRQRY